MPHFRLQPFALLPIVSGMWQAVVLLTIVVIPAEAFAWRQTMTCLREDPPAPTATPFCVGNQFPKPLSWPTNQVSYSVNERGSTQFPSDDGMISPELLDTIRTSFDTWNDPECSNFEFVYEGLTPVSEFDNSDGLNIVVFQDEDWPYGDSALAITTVSATPDGEITSADMELNSANQLFGFVDDPSSTLWDVQNTITHEAGHIVGLDHDAVPDSTMEFEAARGETKKRDLSRDDIEGLCTIHPSGEELDEPDPVPPEEDGCCATTARNEPAPLLMLALVAAAAVRRKQQREPEHGDA